MVFFSALKEYIRTSLWVIPVSMGLFSLLLSIGLFYFELAHGPLIRFELIKDVSVGSFSNTFSTLLAAIVTVFGILLPMIFSILIRASNQFSPRILRTYRSAVAPKVLVGLMLATILYFMSFLIIANYFSAQIISPTSLFLAFLFVVLTIYSIPSFFDQFAASLEPVYIVSHIANDLKALLKSFDDINSSNGFSSFRQDRSFLDSKKYQFRINSPKTGYIQAIDYNSLVEICHKNSILAAVPVRPGEFILEHSPILFSNERQSLTTEVKENIYNCFAFSKRCSGISDLEFQLDELVGIVVRALSPGVTDIATAIECINHVGFACNELLNRRLKSGIHLDKENKQRLLSKEFDFYGFVHAAFDPIRQNINSQPLVVIHVLKVVQNLTSNCKHKDRAAVLANIALQFIKEANKQVGDFDMDRMQRFLESIESNVHQLK